MANAILAPQSTNLLDTSTLTGPMWTDLENVKDSDLGTYTVSSDVSTSSTQILIDYGSSKYARVFAAVDTNGTAQVEMRVETSAIASFSTVTYDSDWQPQFANSLAWDLLEWEDDNWWLGTPTEETLDLNKRNLIHVAPTNQASRYVRISFRDEENPDGFLLIRRMYVGPCWQFTANMAWGAGIGPESNTLVDKTFGNVEDYDRRNPDNVIAFSLDFMTEAEAFTKAQPIERQLDIDGEVLFIYDPDDTAYGMWRNIWGHLRALSKTEAYVYGLFRKAWEIGERF